jgi:conjugal transfer ATP-binding protein TraC
MNNILHIENNKIVFSNGVFGIVYKLKLPEKYSLGKEDYTALNDYWHAALKDLPIGSIFYKQDAFIESKFDTSFFADSNFIQKSTKRFYKDFDYIKHDCYLFFMLPSKEINNSSLINPFKTLNKKAFDLFDENIEAFTNSVDSVVLSLNAIKLQGGNKIVLSPISEQDLIDYYDLYFNLFNEDSISDILANTNSINVGTKYGAIIAMCDEDKIPDELESTRKDKFLSNDKTLFFRNYGDSFAFDLPFSHIYNQICIIDDNRKQLDLLKVRNEKLHKTKGFDNANKHFAKVTDDIIQDITENQDVIRLIRGHNNLIIISDSEDELAKNLLKANANFRELDIKPYIPTGNYLNAMFLYSFPFFTQNFTESQLYVTSLNIFCSFLNNTGDYKSDSQGVFFNSRLSNIPVKIDTWDEKNVYMNARNFMILAPTGEGKSFLANHLISTAFFEEKKIVLVDLGGSYLKLSYLFPNDIVYITYEVGQSLGINPFEKNIIATAGQEIEEEITAEKYEELAEFVALHYIRDEPVSEIERVSLKKIIEAYYESDQKEYSLQSFVYYVRDTKNLLLSLNIKESFFNIDVFNHLMSEFIDDGIYSFLYKKSDKDIGGRISQKKIIVFELDAVRSNPLLLTIMLQLVSNIIHKIIWKDKRTKGIVLFDEVAEQLKWNGVLGRIEYFYQAIRKQGGSVGMILQSETQLPATNTSENIIKNTQVLYVVKSIDYKALQSRFNLSEHAYYQMSSIQSNFASKMPYSEIFIKRGDSHQVYRLSVPKEVFWAYQTNGQKNEELIDLYKITGDMESAINQFLTLNP